MIVSSRVALHLPDKPEVDSSTSEESSINYNRNLASLGLFDRKTPTPLGMKAHLNVLSNIDQARAATSSMLHSSSYATAQQNQPQLRMKQI